MKKCVEESYGTYNEKEQLNRILYEFSSTQIISYQKKEIGMIKVKKELDIWHLIQIQILPEYQKKGFGSSILHEIITKAKKAGIPIKLHVLKSNPAQHLYAKLGFHIIEELERAFIMKKGPSIESV